MKLTPSNMGLVALATLRPDIRTDTNRDGGVDISGNSDVFNKAVQSASNGAIFPSNIGDTTGRCPNSDLNGGQLSNTELAFYNDASGDVLLSLKYVAPLRTVPMKNLSPDAYGYVYATPDVAAYERVRLSIKEHGDYGDSTSGRGLISSFGSMRRSSRRAFCLTSIFGN